MLIGVCRIFLFCFVFAVLPNGSYCIIYIIIFLYYIIIFLCYVKKNHFMQVHLESLQCLVQNTGVEINTVLRNSVGIIRWIEIIFSYDCADYQYIF